MLATVELQVAVSTLGFNSQGRTLSGRLWLGSRAAVPAGALRLIVALVGLLGYLSVKPLIEPHRPTGARRAPD